MSAKLKPKAILEADGAMLFKLIVLEIDEGNNDDEAEKVQDSLRVDD